MASGTRESRIKDKSRVAISVRRPRGRVGPVASGSQESCAEPRIFQSWRAKLKNRIRLQGGRGREFRNPLYGTWPEFEPEFGPESAPSVKPYTTT